MKYHEIGHNFQKRCLVYLLTWCNMYDKIQSDVLKMAKILKFMLLEDTKMSMIRITKNMEPLWDYYLVDKENTTAILSPNSPKKEEVVFTHINPLGREIFYPVIFKDGDIYRMYYGTGFRYKDPVTNKFNEEHLVTCYAESEDGLKWEFPNLGIYGDTNCIIADENESRVGICVFKDNNPACLPEEKYKGILRVSDGGKVFLESGTLACYVSPDGIHFKRGEDIAREPGKYDSLNTVFWDEMDKEYKLYYRDFDNGIRSIKMKTSKDFKNWDDHGFLKFDDDQQMALYTNNIVRCPGSPQVFVGLPQRYIERSTEWIPSFDKLPDIESRRWRLSMHPRYAFALTDTLFMVSHDGLNWHKFNEAIADGGEEAPGTWKYGDTYFNYGFVEDETTLSCYAADSMWDGDKTDLRRYSFRKGGFASFKSGWNESIIKTKPFIYSGDKFNLNFRTSAAGYIKIKLVDSDGNVNESCEIFGNNISREIVFEKRISEFSEREVTMEISMRDAEVYAFQIC